MSAPTEEQWVELRRAEQRYLEALGESQYREVDLGRHHDRQTFARLAILHTATHEATT